jgi:hypothetical protein
MTQVAQLDVREPIFSDAEISWLSRIPHCFLSCGPCLFGMQKTLLYKDLTHSTDRKFIP